MTRRKTKEETKMYKAAKRTYKETRKKKEERRTYDRETKVISKTSFNAFYRIKSRHRNKEPECAGECGTENQRVEKRKIKEQT